MTDAPRFVFTVFTPTYNRAHLLPQVHASLAGQTFRDFEWLIVDDGSVDDTRALVEGWQRQGAFPIRYVHQPNGGKHRAMNRGVREARGALFLTLDSDDVCLPEALARLHFHWRAIPDAERPGFSAVTGLCVDGAGRVVGDPFPSDVFDSAAAELAYVVGVRGDKWGFQRTDVMRRFPFPEFAGERFVPECVVWNRIGRHFRTRYVNEPLLVHEYHADGLTAATVKARATSPHGTRLAYREALAEPAAPSVKARHLVNYVRFSLHAGIGLPRIVGEVGAEAPPLRRWRWRGAAVALLPAGIAAWQRDRVVLLRAGRGDPGARAAGSP